MQIAYQPSSTYIVIQELVGHGWIANPPGTRKTKGVFFVRRIHQGGCRTKQPIKVFVFIGPKGEVYIHLFPLLFHTKISSNLPVGDLPVVGINKNCAFGIWAVHAETASEFPFDGGQTGSSTARAQFFKQFSRPERIPRIGMVQSRTVYQSTAASAQGL